MKAFLVIISCMLLTACDQLADLEPNPDNKGTDPSINWNVSVSIIGDMAGTVNPMGNSTVRDGDIFVLKINSDREHTPFVKVNGIAKQVSKEDTIKFVVNSNIPVEVSFLDEKTLMFTNKAWYLVKSDEQTKESGTMWIHMIPDKECFTDHWKFDQDGKMFWYDKNEVLIGCGDSYVWRFTPSGFESGQNFWRKDSIVLLSKDSLIVIQELTGTLIKDTYVNYYDESNYKKYGHYE